MTTRTVINSAQNYWHINMQIECAVLRFFHASAINVL